MAERTELRLLKGILPPLYRGNILGKESDMCQKFNNFRVAFVLCFVTLYLFIPLSLKAVNAQEDFYKGKTIRIVVGFSAGGGYDTYSRAIARHLGKHIPGNPKVIVENMPGASSLIAANHLYRIAKPDGLSIANIHGNQILNQVLGRPGIEFDARRFEYIGVPTKFGYVCAFTKASGITSMEKWMASKKLVKVGATGPGSSLYDAPRILQTVLGVPTHIVSGYKSIGDIRLAAEAGEVDGICGVGWQVFKAVWRRAIEAGDVVVVLQMLPQGHPDLPHVPLAINFAKTEEARQLIKAGIHDSGAFVFVYALPPATPKDRVGILRQAFLNTMKDPEFLADAKKSKLDINPLTGDELEENIREIFKLEPGLTAKLKEILK